MLQGIRGEGPIDFSSDCRTMAYEGVTGHSNLWVVSLEPDESGNREEPRRLTTGTHADGAPSVSLDGRFVSIPLSLFSGANQVQFQVNSEGTTPLTVFEIQVSHVSGGSASQFSRALRAGESEVITITAP